MAFWVQTYMQRTFRIDHPDPRDVNIRDIAHALSLQCRFNGHVREFYSVAQHSLIVSDVAQRLHEEEPESAHANAALAGLLHDAHEAYIGDLVRPVKAFIAERWDWTLMEERAEFAVTQAFHLDCRPSRLECVKRADMLALATEARDLLPGGPISWKTQLPDPLPETIVPMSPGDAEQAFLRRFEICAGCKF